MINSKTLKQRRSPVGGDCYHTIFNAIFKTKFEFFSLPYVGAMAIAPYRFFKNQKHYNLPHFSHKLFFNVKITKKVNYQ
jgi:hypothetical protein